MISSLRFLYNSTLRIGKCRVAHGRCSSTQSNTTGDDMIDITSVEEVPRYEKELTEQERIDIMAKRNKSRLSPGDRNRLSESPPYNNEDLMWFHHTIRYKKRMFGRYGMRGLNVPVGALWPLEEEVIDKIEFEKTATPYTVQEGWALIAKRNHEKSEQIRLREEEIAMKLGKVEQWRQEFYAKIARRNAALLAAKERKQKLIEEVRREFGFKIDPRDERFTQALEQREKEDKKRKKEAKKQNRSAKMMAKLLEKSTPTNELVTQPGSTEPIKQ